MANLKGAGAHKDVNLLIEVSNSNERGKFLIAQVDQSLKNPDKVREGASVADPNPYLSSKEKTLENGDKFVDHGVFYQNSQIEKMEAVAKKVEVDGKTYLGLKASVFPNAGDGEKSKPKFDELVIDTSKPMAATDNPRFGKTTPEKQANVQAAARDFRAAQREAKAKNIEAQAEAQEATMETPSVEIEQPEA